jgi:fructose-1-phosphate kinase PfkB-like protein
MSMIEAVRLGVACGSANALTEQAGFLDRTDVERFVAAIAVT